MNRCGFTLVEIMITVVIIGVIAVLAIPRYTNSVERTRASDGVQILRTLFEAQELYFVEHNFYTDDSEALEIDPNEIFSQYFDSIKISSVADNLAEVTRKGSPTYTLSIDIEAVISCSNGTGNICQRIGY